MDLAPSPSPMSSPIMDLPSSSSLPFNRERRRKKRFGEWRSCERILVSTQASVGRFSGAVHGSHSRKSSRRRNIGQFEVKENCDNEEHDAQQKEIVHEPSTGGTEVLRSCDDVLNAKVYDDHVTEDRSRSFCLYADAYDSIHGEYWSNDPYYKELDVLHEETWSRPGMDAEAGLCDDKTGAYNGKYPCPSSDDCSDSTSLETHADANNRNECIANSGNTSSHPILQNSNHPVSRVIEGQECTPLQLQEGREVSGALPVTVAEVGPSDAFASSVLTLENQRMNQECISTFQHMSGGKHVFEVRKTDNGQRPAEFLGSLKSVDTNEIGSRQCPGNIALNWTALGSFAECRSDVMQHAHAKLDVVFSDNINDYTDEQPSDSHLQSWAINHETVLTAIESTKDSQEREKLDQSVCFEVENNAVETAMQTGQDDNILIPVAEQVGQVVEQVADLIPTPVKEQVVQVVDQVEKFPGQVSQAAEQAASKVVGQVAEVLPDPVLEQVGQVAEQVSTTAEQIVEHVASHVVDPITTTASQIASFLSADDEDDESDDEFEAYRSSDIPEFKGAQGLNNFTVLQEDQGILSVVYDFYIVMLKKPLPEFVLGMFAAPILLSAIFTILYLPEFDGLSLDETARDFFRTSGGNTEAGSSGLQLSWRTVFEVFMFSISLSTGLQPELAPLSPYTLIVANLNALFAQLIFVFLSGAVFARLSQPSQPVKCSTVALVCPPPSNRRLRKEARYKSLLTRYVLVGPQPSELVDVKVDLTYKYNTITRTGTFFRTSQSLKLMYHGVTQVRPEIAYLNHGMLVRHIIDESSPLFQRTPGMLEKEDAVFSLSVVGLERASMQSIFHVQHYCVYDGDVIWDAEFEDMILISKKNRRVVDHSLLSKWRPIICK